MIHFHSFWSITLIDILRTSGLVIFVMDPPRKTETSPVWQHFDPISPNNWSPLGSTEILGDGNEFIHAFASWQWGFCVSKPPLCPMKDCFQRQGRSFQKNNIVLVPTQLRSC